jgi:dTDP-4-amino-4,6-dideoxygalactose transaminase
VSPARKLAILGGEPASARPLHIVRPSFPDLGSFETPFREALASGAVTNHGPAVREFEKRLADYLGSDVVVCNNGQSALMIMLRAAGVEGGEVIVPSYTFSATAHAVRWCGATPVFADIGGEDSPCIDPSSVERLVTERTVAILGVDVYGLACDYEALAAIGRRAGVRVLYDSAPAFGTRVGGRPIGRFGDAQIFSFHATKAFATMEGGCISSGDAEILRRARALRNFGQEGGADCEEPGINAKMPEVCALIGIRALERFDACAAHRVRVAELYRKGLAGVPGLVLPRVPEGQTPIWLYFPIVLDPATFGLDRDQLALVLERENIHVRKYFELPCHHMRAYARGPHAPLPITERVAYRVVALPVYNDMSDAEVEIITDAIARAHACAGELQEALKAAGGATLDAATRR